MWVIWMATPWMRAGTNSTRNVSTGCSKIFLTPFSLWCRIGTLSYFGYGSKFLTASQQQMFGILFHWCLPFSLPKNKSSFWWLPTFTATPQAWWSWIIAPHAPSRSACAACATRPCIGSSVAWLGSKRLIQADELQQADRVFKYFLSFLISLEHLITFATSALHIEHKFWYLIGRYHLQMSSMFIDPPKQVSKRWFSCSKGYTMDFRIPGDTHLFAEVW